MGYLGVGGGAGSLALRLLSLSFRLGLRLGFFQLFGVGFLGGGPFVTTATLVLLADQLFLLPLASAVALLLLLLQLFLLQDEK